MLTDMEDEVVDCETIALCGISLSKKPRQNFLSSSSEDFLDLFSQQDFGLQAAILTRD